MKKSFIFIFTLLLLQISSISFSMGTKDMETLYNKMQLEKEFSFDLFKDAIIGYNKIESKKDILTIIDYSKPSTEERFYVLDLKKEKVIYKSLVAHGVNTGGTTAEKFSNTVDSRKSSLGFFLTNETYYGSNGYSLRLDGLENGINDRARERLIVIHGAAYANESFMEKNGRLGRSWGCPALPENISQDIINTIKGGSVIFVYGNDNTYLEKTNLI